MQRMDRDLHKSTFIDLTDLYEEVIKRICREQQVTVIDSRLGLRDITGAPMALYSTNTSSSFNMALIIMTEQNPNSSKRYAN